MLGFQIGGGVMVNYVSIIPNNDKRLFKQVYVTPILNLAFKIDRGKKNKVLRIYTTPNVLDVFEGEKENTYFGFSLGFLLKY